MLATPGAIHNRSPATEFVLTREGETEVLKIAPPEATPDRVERAAAEILDRARSRGMRMAVVLPSRVPPGCEAKSPSIDHELARLVDRGFSGHIEVASDDIADRLARESSLTLIRVRGSVISSNVRSNQKAQPTLPAIVEARVTARLEVFDADGQILFDSNEVNGRFVEFTDLLGESGGAEAVQRAIAEAISQALARTDLNAIAKKGDSIGE